MYFFHPDHLGSITMITDGNGNVLAGGERGGKSHITYKPYGEILRTDSYGPDITKFKYTGQEEDQESGLYYYKARYYDASLGRFASNDGMVFPDKEQGMNRMMYVEGNPIAFVDSSGNFPSLSGIIHMFNRIVGHAMGRNFGSNVNGRFSVAGVSNGLGASIQRMTFIRFGRFMPNEVYRTLQRSTFISSKRLFGMNDLWDRTIGHRGLLKDSRISPIRELQYGFDSNKNKSGIQKLMEGCWKNLTACKLVVNAFVEPTILVDANECAQQGYGSGCNSPTKNYKEEEE
ncbi:RHS repeat domain-containing protein [Leptospira meyeri]|uniref:RHS repeat domain-containing protein n=1 Tax=Leptospira meyeri TaxID=29508 RepID=UPI001FEDE321|nr:RHS repeat-associated core domain-containing protein [Leptospira meyeri]